ncbi:MAG: S-layer homology domain-containing protein [Clostridia bacterium]|nr:S-layer homology domain-containing protein [Clostridia bacterium]
MFEGEKITIGMVATLLYNLSKNDFTKNNSEAIKWAINLGIINDAKENKVEPDQYVKREELAIIIFRFIEKMNINIPAVLMLYPPYDDDENISEYAKVAVEQMRYTRLMLGNEENKFKPKADVTKSEAEDIFAKLAKALEKQRESIRESKSEYKRECKRESKKESKRECERESKKESKRECERDNKKESIRLNKKENKKNKRR